VYYEQGQTDKVESLLKESLDIKRREYGNDHPTVLKALNNLALLYQEQGRYAEAEPLYRQALAIREKVLGPDHTDVAFTLNNLGELLDRDNSRLLTRIINSTGVLDWVWPW